MKRNLKVDIERAYLESFTGDVNESNKFMIHRQRPVNTSVKTDFFKLCFDLRVEIVGCFVLALLVIHHIMSRIKSYESTTLREDWSHSEAESPVLCWRRRSRKEAPNKAVALRIGI